MKNKVFIILVFLGHILFFVYWFFKPTSYKFEVFSIGNLYRFEIVTIPHLFNMKRVESELGQVIFRGENLINSWAGDSLIGEINKNASRKKVNIPAPFRKHFKNLMEFAQNNETGYLLSNTADPKKSFKDFVIYDSKTDELFVSSPKVKLNFDHISDGMLLDIIDEFLEEKGIHNFVVSMNQANYRIEGKNCFKSWRMAEKLGSNEITMKVKKDLSFFSDRENLIIFSSNSLLAKMVYLEAKKVKKEDLKSYLEKFPDIGFVLLDEAGKVAFRDFENSVELK